MTRQKKKDERVIFSQKIKKDKNKRCHEDRILAPPFSLPFLLLPLLPFIILILVGRRGCYLNKGRIAWVLVRAGCTYPFPELLLDLVLSEHVLVDLFAHDEMEEGKGKGVGGGRGWGSGKGEGK